MTESPVVVIGSGPTGAVATQVLLEHGVHVTMLESGQRPPGGVVLRAMGHNLFRKGRPVGNQNPYVPLGETAPIWIHELSPGGLTNHWTGAVPRFGRCDFDDGARLHERYRWPVSYDSLEPFYGRVERMLGVRGGRSDVDSLPESDLLRCVQLPRSWRPAAVHARAHGQDLLPMPMALGRDWTLKSGGTPFNSFTDIVQRLDSHQNFRLLLQSHALRIEHDEAGHARRVIYHNVAQGVERAIDCRAVVIAAGALASTKLLLDSTSGTFPRGLGNANGLLGTHLHDHPLQMCVIELGKSMPRLGHPAYLTRAPYAESPPLLAAGCLLGARISQLDRLLTLTPVRTRAFGASIFGTMVPTCEGRVTSHSELKDRFGLPQLEIALKFGPDVSENLEKARERLLTVLDSAGLQPSVRALYPVFQPGASVHFGGTTRMHASPEYGVTNGWGRLHDVPNVMVADSSVFTTSVEKNPVLTAMALAARGATRLASDLKCGAA